MQMRQRGRKKKEEARVEVGWEMGVRMNAGESHHTEDRIIQALDFGKGADRHPGGLGASLQAPLTGVRTASELRANQRSSEVIVLTVSKAERGVKGITLNKILSTLSNYMDSNCDPANVDCKGLHG